MSDRTSHCKAKNAKGEPCSATPWQDGYCRWHHPEMKDVHRETSRKGGQNRSNAARARKRFQGTIKDYSELQGTLLQAMEDVKAGKLDPGPANAMANLARAVQSLAPVATFDALMTELRAEIAEAKAMRSA